MKILSTIFYTVLVALIVGVAGLLIGTMLPIPGNIEIKIVKSGSMEPAIPTGSLVFVKPEALYKKGDVITFGADTKTAVPTTHRIITLNDDGTYTVKGDANEEADESTVARRDVIGKVLFHVPNAGYLLDFARQPIGFALLIGIPAALVILEEALTIFRETRKWWRRRDGNGSSDAGGSGIVDLRQHLKRVYAKRRDMDEIKVAVYVQPHFYESLWWRKKLGLDTDAYGTSTSLTVGLVFVATLFTGHSGGTISYFSDIERSVGNIFAAGVWESTALVEEVVEEIEPFAALAAEGTEESADGAVLGESDGGGGGSAEIPKPVEEEGLPEEVPLAAPTDVPVEVPEVPAVTETEPETNTEVSSEPPVDAPEEAEVSEPTPEPNPEESTSESTPESEPVVE